MSIALKINNTASNIKNFIIENRRPILVAALVASLATTILGFAFMAFAERLTSSISFFACTMDSCNLITFTTLDPTFAKGLFLSLSGLLVTHTIRSALA